MNREDNIALVEQWYDALQAGAVDAFVSLHHGECVYNISGHTPISGQIDGMNALTEHVLPLVFGALDMSKFRFCTRRSIMCADSERVVGVMEADGPGNNGVRYDQRYVHIFSIADERIASVWEFFDTALANAVMFPDPDQLVPGVERGGFDLG
jgi:ketosteroid isomerase-like protein